MYENSCYRVFLEKLFVQKFIYFKTITCVVMFIVSMLINLGYFNFIFQVNIKSLLIK